MADYIRGIKAGVVAGVIFAIVSGVLGVIQMYTYYSSSSTLSYPMGSFVSMSILLAMMSIVTSIVWGIIGGLILGLIFAFLYDKLPGDSSLIKGVTLSILLWLIFSVGFGYVMMTITSSDFSHYYELSMVFGIISYVILGVVLGVSWDKFKGSVLYCKQCGRTIPTNARLCPYCGVQIQENIMYPQ